MTKKTIAFVIPSLSAGGAERVVSNLGNELVKTYNVIIITFSKGQPFYSLSDKVKLLYCSPNIEPSKSIFQALRTNYLLYKRISKIFKAEKVDLGIGFMTTANVLAILASKANGIPVIISERINPYKSETPFVWRQIKKLVYPKTDYLVVQTQTIKKFFMATVAEPKLIILPNPLSADLRPTTDSFMEREKVILNVGRLTDQKGQDILIKAFSNLNPPDWKLVIVGEGRNREAYEKLIDNYKMNKSIFLVGQKKDVSTYFNTSKIFAFTSRFEGFPNALIEAMFMGLACISTDCPTGPSELIQDGKNGFLITVDNEKQLEERLKTLMKNPELMENFSNYAKDTAQDFKVENVVKEWNRIILLLLQP